VCAAAVHGQLIARRGHASDAETKLLQFGFWKTRRHRVQDVIGKETQLMTPRARARRDQERSVADPRGARVLGDLRADDFGPSGLQQE
jgi:hypothetical protein